MDYLSIIALIVSIIAVIVSYWQGKLVRHQITKLEEELETAKRQLDVDAVGMTNHELAAIDEVLIQYPKFRRCFYNGIDPSEVANLTSDDKEQIKAIAARLVNGNASILLQSRKKLETSGQDDALSTSASWAKATVASRYANSPACCEHLMTHIEEYGYTGRYQIHLLFDGLEQARNAALERNDLTKVARLEARIKDAEAKRDSVLRCLAKSRTHYKEFDSPSRRIEQ